MSHAHSISTRRAYGVQRVCRVWDCARSSVYARRQATRSRTPLRRRGPVGAAPDDVLVDHIRRMLEASPFHGEGYWKPEWHRRSPAGRYNGTRRPPEPVPEPNNSWILHALRALAHGPPIRRQCLPAASR